MDDLLKDESARNYNILDYNLVYWKGALLENKVSFVIGFLIGLMLEAYIL